MENAETFKCLVCQSDCAAEELSTDMFDNICRDCAEMFTIADEGEG